MLPSSEMRLYKAVCCPRFMSLSSILQLVQSTGGADGSSRALTRDFKLPDLL